MRIQIRILLSIISTCFLLGGVNSSWAASVGGSFVGRGGGPGASLAPADSAGVIPQAFWNNIDSGEPQAGQLDGTSLPHIDDAGNFTAVKIIYDANDSWNSDGGTATPDEKLMKGIIKANPEPDLAPVNNTDRMVFVITNLSPAGTYTIVVYATANGTFAKMDLSVGATTYYFEEANNFTSQLNTFVPASSTTPGAYEVGVNYAGFTNVTPAVNGTITITARKFIEDPQVNDGIGVAAIQIVQVSGPAFPPNTDACSITTNPQSPAPVVAGKKATFTVGTQGPCRIQWTKNNVPIPGAASPTLVFATVLADDGAQIRAIVYNNVNTNTSTAATLTVVPPTLTQGFLTVERWEGIGGTAVAPLITVIGAGTDPTTEFFVLGPDVPPTSPDVNDFGGRVSGWVKPDVTGEYHFFIRSDDASQLFLNPVNPGAGTNALPDVTVDIPICEETACCNGFQEPGSPRTTAIPIFLEAGKLYGITALYKEGGGGDFLQVAWRITNSPIAAASLRPISPANCFTLATGIGQGASITTQPTSATVFEGRTASFTVGATTTPVAGFYGVQWRANGSAIPGATAGTYTTPPTALSDSGKQYQAYVFTLPGPLTSSIVTLTVLPDTNPPVPSVGAIIKSDGAIQVGVGFDEAVNQADLIPANFSLIGGSGTVRFPTNSYNDYKGIVFDTTGLVPGGTYTGHVANVRDLKGNAISSGGIDVRFTVGNAGWAETGTPKRPGQVVPVGADGFDILNGGRGEWGSYDEATIAYLKKTNDFDVKVQLIYAEPGSQWTRVGLMARNDLNVGEDPNDRNIPGAGSTASAYAQTHMNPNQTLGSSGRLGPPGPTDPPTVNTAATGGTVADGAYEVKTAYVFANSPESLPSPTAPVSPAGGGTSTITVDSPPALAGATGWYAYITQDGALRYFRQQPGAATAIGTAFVLTTTPSTNGPVTAVPVNPTPNNGHEQNQRLTMGGATTGWGSGVSGIPVYPNEWLRLQRQGTNLFGFRSQDGVNWTAQGSTGLTDQQPHMFVGPFAAVETANIWAGADMDVWSATVNPRYDRLFVYQFRNFGNTFPPSLSIGRSGSDVVVTFTGSLLSSPSLTGPWTPVVSASPYTTPVAGSPRYFRARGDFP